MSHDEPKNTGGDNSAPDLEQKPAAPHSWVGIAIGFSAVLAGLLLIAFLLIQFLAERPINLLDATDALTVEIRQALEHGNIPAQAIKISAPQRRDDPKAHWNFYVIDCEIPSTLSRAGIEKLIRRDMEDRNVRCQGSLTDKMQEGLSLSLFNREFALIRATQAAAPPVRRQAYSPPAPPQQAPAPQSSTANSSTPAAQPAPAANETAEDLPLDSINLEDKDLGQPHVPPGTPPGDLAQPRAAIIVDDGGYGGPATEAILKLDPALTLAILPNTPHATETAEDAEKLGFQVMLHMPMEALSAKDNFPGFISTDMRASQMRAITNAALGQIPGAVGINNHTGSKFTSSVRAMKAFLKGIKGRSLYFVDSHTVAHSVAYTEAQDMGIKSAANNLFLDNNADPAAIRTQFTKFIELCKTHGHAIAICHFRSHSAAVLAQELPKIKSEGIRLVHVSELVR